ncbi:MAG: RNA binding S1 domain protein [Parcubacteria group bacterium GW2011_GWA2_47_64]|nr:MAG: RNA binding S1 domain protein [Parcubacteria group bacterium GW2011_GWA2_47_64]KKU96194.1 MAG: RNA binding S1 domain protein [Parcubacteria group bacterium GW2011_GWC2_48_17]
MTEDTNPLVGGTLMTSDEAKALGEVSQVNEKLMTRLIAASKNPPSVGDLVDGKVILSSRGRVFVDLPPFGTGIIYGREYINARDIIKKINPGDTIAAKIVDFENPDGYIELSLKEARQALIWNEAETAIREKKVFELPVKEANKGGLILEWQGIAGFLPASQLKAEHYPRVPDGDKDKIFEELRKLIGEKLFVAIISVIPKEGKLIFSEKSTTEKEREKIIGKYNVGDELPGEVTGLVDFGVFVKIEDTLEGLVHISEIDWALVEDPRKLYKVGDKVKVKIIEIKENKISLSIKALKLNPWIEAGTKYKKDDVVKGVVIKFNKHGALASIEEGVSGLVHISDFGSEDKLRRNLELGKTYTFKITIFDAKEQKMALSFAGEKK